MTLAVSGKLVRNSLIMYDRETHSFWSHLTGGAIQGPLRGSQLEVVPATESTWAVWKRSFPNSKVLPHDFPGQADQYSDYFAGGDSGILGRKRNDRRLPGKAKVLGVRIMDRPKAYGLDAVARVKVVNDTFDGVPLVVFTTGPDTATIYRRDTSGQTLTFEVASSGLVVDRDTGSTWDPVSGQATGGSLAGSALTKVPSTTSFWFGWYDFFPGTELYTG